MPVRLRCPHRDRRLERIDPDRRPAAKLRHLPETESRLYELQDHFLTRFREAYLAEVIDFVDTILSDRAPRVTGEDGLRAVEIAVAAEKSYRSAAPCAVGMSCLTAVLGLLIRPVSA